MPFTPFEYLQTLAVVEVPDLETTVSSPGDQPEREGRLELKTSILATERERRHIAAQRWLPYLIPCGSKVMHVTADGPWASPNSNA